MTRAKMMILLGSDNLTDAVRTPINSKFQTVKQWTGSHMEQMA